MPSILPLKTMSVEEKIQTMEMLWDDLCRLPDGVKSPDWHQDMLADREVVIERGGEAFEDWEAAKKRIRKRLP